MKTVLAVGLFAILTGALCAGCGSETGSAESVEQGSSALVGVDTFLYLRSNATGWGVDENTRLLPFATSNLFARAVNVTQPWMVSDGDTAIVTETNQLDGWGTTQTYSGAATSPLNEPATSALATQAPGGDAHFKLKYQATGLQRVYVNLNNSPPTLTVEPIVCPACPGPTHCVIEQNSMPTCSL